jgi:hypothetical protein
LGVEWLREQKASADMAAVRPLPDLPANRRITQEPSSTHFRSNCYPGDCRCTCLFEAADAAVVERVDRDAGIPFDKVEQVLDLAP